MKHTDIKKIVSAPAEFFDKEVSVCGWVRSYRDSKNMAFIAINDGTTLNHMQIVIDKNAIANLEDGVKHVGSSVFVKGIAVKSFSNSQGRFSLFEWGNRGGNRRAISLLRR